MLSKDLLWSDPESTVQALMTFRGFQLVAAMITVSELGDIHRFAHPRQLMTYLGLVSVEDSSGPRQRLGAISRCGNGHARWLLVECAEHSVLAPKISKELSRRHEGQPREVLALSWKAQNRLYQRFTRLLARRLQRNKAKVAVARELCGTIFAAWNHDSFAVPGTGFAASSSITGGGNPQTCKTEAGYQNPGGTPKVVKRYAVGFRHDGGVDRPYGTTGETSVGAVTSYWAVADWSEAIYMDGYATAENTADPHGEYAWAVCW